MRVKFNLVKFWVLLAAVLVAAGGFWILTVQSKTYEFVGSVNRIEGNTLFAKGFFLDDGTPLADEGQEGTEIKISVDSATQLTRLAIHIPRGAEMFNVADLVKEESATDLKIIASDLDEYILGLEAILKRRLVSTSFNGKSLYFRVPVFEELPTEGQPPTIYIYE